MQRKKKEVESYLKFWRMRCDAVLLHAAGSPRQVAVGSDHTLCEMLARYIAGALPAREADRYSR